MMRDIIHKYSFLCLLTIIQLIEIKPYGQEPYFKRISPLTPSASSLGRFGDVPVSFYTGLPNISVPIYDIVVKGFHLPISLSYHAEGIRVEEIPSWVGMGWTLNAGGVINREKRGNPDEYLYNQATSEVYKNNFESDINQYLKVFDNPISTGGQINSAVSHLFMNNLSNPINTDYDSERDVFSLIVPNLYQKYIIDILGKAYCIPAAPLKIEPKQLINHINHGFQYSLFSGWNVTDQNGVQYSFGKGSDGTVNADVYDTRNNCGGSNDSPDVISSWYLEKIKLPSGEDITFQYDSVSYCYTTSDQESKRYPDPVSAADGDNHIFHTYVSNAVHYSKAMKIKTITFPEGKVVFSAGVGRNDLKGDYILDNIIIYSKNNSGYTKEKTFQLKYNNRGYRLALLSLQEVSKSGEANAPYVFDYYRSSGDNSNYGLPPFNSPDQDIWGYYNRANNQSLLPGYIFRDNDGKFYGSIKGANRSINTEACKYGTLKTITYPTGGYSEFEYENNRAKGYVSGGSIDPLYLLNNLNATSSTVEKNVYVNVENTNGYDSALSDVFKVNTLDNNGIDVTVNANTFNPGCTTTSPKSGVYGSFYECFSINVLEVDVNGNYLSTYRSQIYFGTNSNLTLYPGHYYKLKVTWNDNSQIGNYARVWFNYMDNQDTPPTILNPEAGVTKKYVNKSVYVDSYNGTSNASASSTPFSINNSHGVTCTISAHLIGKSSNSSNFENDGFEVYILSEKALNTNLWDAGQKLTYSGQTFNLSFNTRYKMQVVWNTSTPTYGDVGVIIQYTDYESVPQLTNYDRIVGGLRVSKITDFEKSNGKKKVRKFFYEMNQKDDGEAGSAGILMNVPTFFSVYSDYQLSPSGILSLFPNTFHITSFASTPQIFTQGAIVGYRKVTEQLGENGEGGYTNYYYTSALDYPDDLIDKSYYYPHPHTTSYDWRRGLLTKQIHYQNEGSKISKVMSIANTYSVNTNVNSDFQKTIGNVSVWRGTPWFFHAQTTRPMIIVDGIIVQQPDAVSEWIISYPGAANYYKTIIESFPMIKQEVHSFVSGRDIIKTTNYEQSPYCLTTAKSTTTNSNGKQITLVEKTVGDIVIATTVANDPVAVNLKNMLTTQHNLMAPVEQYKMQTDASGNKTILGGEVMTYNLQLLPHILYKLESSSPIPENQFIPSYVDASGNYIKDSHYQPEIYFDLYDSYHNLQQIHDRSNTYTTYLWGADGQHLIAKIVGADLSTVNSVITQSQINSVYYDENALRALLQTLRTDNRTKYAQITTYTYALLIGMVTATDPRGVTTNYTYDMFNRLFLARNDDKKVVAKYSYGYQNSPDDGMGGYSKIRAQINCDNTWFLPGTVGEASVRVSGGSGDYTYAWSLANSSGIALANGSGQDFRFNCTAIGSMLVSCRITDCLTGISDSTVQSINCVPPPKGMVNFSTEGCVENTSFEASVNMEGGSGKYSYSWYVKTKAGADISLDNTTGESITLALPSTGEYAVYCNVVDDNTKAKITLSRSLICYSKPTLSAFSVSKILRVQSAGYASATATGGSGSFRYSFFVQNSSGATDTLSGAIASTSFAFTPKSVGTVQITGTVTDITTGFGVSKTVSVNCYQALSLAIKRDPVAAVMQYANTATAILTNGVGTYNYEWVVSNDDNRELQASASDQTENTFSFTCRDVGSTTITCIATNSETGEVIENKQTFKCYTPPAASLSNVPAYCMQRTPFSVSVAPSGGSGKYTYSWSCINGTIDASATASSCNITGTAFGAVKVICTVTDSVTLKTVSSSQSIPCYTTPNITLTTNKRGYVINEQGTATASVSGGSGNYIYSWEQANSSDSIIARSTETSFAFNCLEAGHFILRCKVTDVLTSMSSDISKTVYIYLQPVGNIRFWVAGGVVDTPFYASINMEKGSGKYSYTWYVKTNNGISIPFDDTTGESVSFTLPSIGEYTVCCYVIDDITQSNITVSKILTCYTQPSRLTLSGSDVIRVNSLESVCAKVSGGSGGNIYSFEIQDARGFVVAQSHASTSPCLSFTPKNLGILRVEVDAIDTITGGALNSLQFFVCEPELNLDLAMPKSCVTNVESQAIAFLSEDSGFYTYTWKVTNNDTGILQASASDQTANTFSFTCRDVGATTITCIATNSETGEVIENKQTFICYTPPAASLSNVPAYCMQRTPFSVSVAPSGGSGKYIYSWSCINGTIDGSATGSSCNITGTAFGAVKVTCTVTDSATLKTVSSSQSIPCYTTPNITLLANKRGYVINEQGTATASVSGGSGNYTYSWELASSSDLMIQSSSNLMSNNFSFSCPTIGSYHLKCSLIDQVTGLQVSSLLYLQACVAVSDVSLRFDYTSVENAIYNYGINSNLSLTFYSSFAIQPNVSYWLGTIGSSCRPSTTRTITSYSVMGRTWQLTIEASGEIYIKMTRGEAMPAYYTEWIGGDYTM